MGTIDQNLAAFERSVAKLKVGGFLDIKLADLRHTFGIETEEAAIGPLFGFSSAQLVSCGERSW